MNTAGLVIFIVILIALGYMLWIWTVFLPWQTWFLGSNWGLINLMYLHVLLFMLFWTYFSAIFTSPGHPSPSWRPMATDEELRVAKEEGRSRHDPHQPIRWCERCKLYKPPRAHHCRMCNRCVLRMDHHCPWINNCVGFRNHHDFVLFTLYAPLTIFYYHAFFFIRLYHLVVNSTSPEVQVPLIIVYACILIPTAIMITSLFVWQLWLVSRGRTTVEYTEEQYGKGRRRRRHVHTLPDEEELEPEDPLPPRSAPSPHPYNLGPVDNLHLFFGRSPLDWFLPSQPTGNGISFRTSIGYMRQSEDA